MNKNTNTISPSRKVTTVYELNLLDLPDEMIIEIWQRADENTKYILWNINTFMRKLTSSYWFDKYTTSYAKHDWECAYKMRLYRLDERHIIQQYKGRSSAMTLPGRCHFWYLHICVVCNKFTTERHLLLKDIACHRNCGKEQSPYKLIPFSTAQKIYHIPRNELLALRYHEEPMQTWITINREKHRKAQVAKANQDRERIMTCGSDWERIWLAEIDRKEEQSKQRNQKPVRMMKFFLEDDVLAVALSKLPPECF